MPVAFAMASDASAVETPRSLLSHGAKTVPRARRTTALRWSGSVAANWSARMARFSRVARVVSSCSYVSTRSAYCIGGQFGLDGGKARCRI
jgi:hypothetical protein